MVIFVLLLCLPAIHVQAQSSTNTTVSNTTTLTQVTNVTLTQVTTQTQTTTVTNTSTTVATSTEVQGQPEVLFLVTQAPADMVMQFTETNNVSLKVLPESTGTPLKYSVVTNPQYTQVDAHLNNSDTYFVHLTLNYLVPTTGNLTLNIYSGTSPTTGSQVNFTGVNQESLNLVIVAGLYINYQLAIDRAVNNSLGYVANEINQNHVQDIQAQNQEVTLLSQMFIASSSIAALALVFGLVAYLRLRRLK
ncbi:MAG: hypothetical protein KGN01_06460 [Patescibacteria group bacterium]|nr:hypothetical protein [Patescibacteria group bacterium]